MKRLFALYLESCLNVWDTLKLLTKHLDYILTICLAIAYNIVVVENFGVWESLLLVIVGDVFLFTLYNTWRLWKQSCK